MEKSVLTFAVLLAFTYLLQGTLSTDEKLAVKTRLIKKSSVKSFQTEYGDIVDCVDIYKQLAFDHPLLKNHTIQMKPSTETINFKHATSNKASGFSRISLSKMKCPRGTVPIQRIREEERIAMQKFKPSMAVDSSSSSFSASSTDIGLLMAVNPNYGIASLLNVWNPEVKDDKFYSSGSIYVANDFHSATNLITAGWSVHPSLYPNSSRLTAYWTVDGGIKTGCYNMLCPGFVQTSEVVHLGLIFHPMSQYDSDQYDIDIGIRQDSSTKNWWLRVLETDVGYWPKELFTSLTNGGNRVVWGGEVLGNVGMGSGHFPNEGFKKAAYISIMKILVNSSTNTWISPITSTLKLGLSKPNCFNISYHPVGDEFWGHHMYYGGPPSCT